MLAVTHLVSGAVVGRRCRSRRAAVVLGLLSHLVLDGVDHDDESVGVLGQGALAAVGLAVLLRRHRLSSPAMVASLTATLPDAEVAARILMGHEHTARYVFPSHWGPPGSGHPYRVPRLFLPVSVELVLSGACLALLATTRAGAPAALG